MAFCLRASVALVLLFKVAVGVNLTDEVATLVGDAETSFPNCTINCTKADSADARRLWQADETGVEDFPYVAAVMRGAEIWCGAAIIKPNFLLTTANCFWLIHKPEESMTVVYGMSSTGEDPERQRIERVVKHPKWKPPPHPADYDVAVICVSKYINFRADLHDVELPAPGFKPHSNILFVTGFGWNNDIDYSPRTRPVSRQMHSYDTIMMPRKMCADKLATEDLVLTDRFICLKAEPQKAPCVRDTGAPAVFDGRLWGLASWSVRKACGDEDWPVVFTSVAEESIMEFIQFTIDQQMDLWIREQNKPPTYV